MNLLKQDEKLGRFTSATLRQWAITVRT